MAPSVLEEKIFENRFMHAPELERMGAQIDVQRRHGHGQRRRQIARGTGDGKRTCARRFRSSLRAWPPRGRPRSRGSITSIAGYEHVVTKLSGIGANIERIKE